MISVVLADDHAILREGVRLMLEGTPDIRVVGQAGDGLEAIQLATSLLPDLLLLDLHMPRLDGLEACERMHRLAPTVKVLVLSHKDSLMYLDRALLSGARGFVLKQGALEELVTAIRVVVTGEMYLSPPLTSMFVRRHFEQQLEQADRSRQLSQRETEVLKLIAEGMTNPDISKTLHLSIKTVQSHRTNIMTKLSLHDRVDLVKYAIRIGLVDGAGGDR